MFGVERQLRIVRASYNNNKIFSVTKMFTETTNGSHRKTLLVTKLDTKIIRIDIDRRHRLMKPAPTELVICEEHILFLPSSDAITIRS